MQKLEDKKGSLKSLVFTQRHPIAKKKAVFALIKNTLQSEKWPMVGCMFESQTQ